MAEDRGEPGRRRAWGSLGRDQIVAAALAIARREGVAALSIRRLASELGASRMALYRHVADKEALLDLMAGAIAERDLPALVDDRGDWEDQLRRLAYALRERLHAYPGLAELLLRRGNVSPAGLAFADHALAILHRAGLPPAEAARAYVAIFDVILARVQREVGGDPEERLLPQVEAAREREPSELPHLAAALGDLEAITADDVFDAELSLLIAGLRAQLRASS